MNVSIDVILEHLLLSKSPKHLYFWRLLFQIPVLRGHQLNNSLYDQSILLLPLSFLLVRIIVWSENCLSKPFAHQSRLFTFKLLRPLKHVYYTGKTCHYQFKCPIPNAHGLLEECRGCWSFKLIGMLFKMKSLNL